MKNTKVLIIDPYLDVLGGGEKHILSIASVFEEKGAHIFLAWDDERIIQDIETRFGIGFKNIALATKLSKKGSFERMQILGKYDYVLYVTDGSYFFSSAKHNFIYSMYPQKSLHKKSFLNKLKWRNYQFITHSDYSARFISSWVGKATKVLYPYIEDEIINRYNLHKKEKIILSVGRFFSHLHSKKQEVLIESFNKLIHSYPQFAEFKLILIGGLKKEDKDYFDKIKSLASQNSLITLLPNASRETLLEYYKKSLLYWHAAGFGVDINTHPEGVEHLGITPLEAMAAGCITICHNSGGPKEYIQDGTNGFLYSTTDELISKTYTSFTDKRLGMILTEEARKTITQSFSYDVFVNNVLSYFAIL